LNSCQGKHWPGSDCAIAGNELKKANQLKMTAAAEKRVMLKPRAFPKSENNSKHWRCAIQPSPGFACEFIDASGLFDGNGWFASAARTG
jgi:hypothetical protein